MPEGVVSVAKGNVDASNFITATSESKPGFFNKLLENGEELANGVGGMGRGVGITKTFSLKFNVVDLVAAKAGVPIIGKDGPKSSFELLGGGVVEIEDGVNMNASEPGFVSDVDAV